jgi:hypothetical protein
MILKNFVTTFQNTIANHKEYSKLAKQESILKAREQIDNKCFFLCFSVILYGVLIALFLLAIDLGN